MTYWPNMLIPKQYGSLTSKYRRHNKNTLLLDLSTRRKKFLESKISHFKPDDNGIAFKLVITLCTIDMNYVNPKLTETTSDYQMSLKYSKQQIDEQKREWQER